jgi:hypothetical protein
MQTFDLIMTVQMSPSHSQLHSTLHFLNFKSVLLSRQRDEDLYASIYKNTENQI